MKSILSRIISKKTAATQDTATQDLGVETPDAKDSSPKGTGAARAPAPAPEALPATTPSRPRLLYVDHIFHIKTRSTIFVADILSTHFDVHTLYIDPDKKVDMSVLEDPAEYVVVFQMDFLTPAFIAAGKRVTVIQMYDGSASLPDTYYRLNRQAQHLNFSSTLHARALSNDVASHLVQYFPDPANVQQVEDFDTLRCFFWQRLPQSHINLSRVAEMLGDQLDKLHVHTPADNGTPFDPADTEAFDCEVTTSDWFEKHSDFTDVVSSCNIFIAPRYGEGIGHAFLEAMARGMIVLAYDLPTHNEYITNWSSGILFVNGIGRVDITGENVDLRQISRNARLAVENGHRNWLESRQSIVDFVLAAKPAQVPPLAQLGAFVSGSIEAYQQGIGNYITFLDRHPELVRALGNWDLMNAELENVTATQTVTQVAPTALFFFGYNGAHMILGQGWSTSETSHIWATSREATLNIPLGAPLPLRTMMIEMRGLGDYALDIEINGVALESVMLAPVLKMFRLDLPLDVFRKNDSNLSVVLRVAADANIPKVEVRPLTFLVKTLELLL